MASLSGPTAGTSYNGSTHFGFANFVNGGTAVNIGSTFIYSTDNTAVGDPFATGSLNWDGTDIVTLMFDYSLSGDSGSNNWIQYGTQWDAPISITTYGSGSVSATFNLATGGPLFVQAYADGMNSNASISNLSVVPEPVSTILFTGGTLLAGRRFLKRKK